MRPGCLEAYRDGKSISNHYIDKKNGLETVDYFHESLEEVLKTIESLRGLQNLLQTDYTFERGDNTLADWEQMLYMSLCSHNIIANSSFSWWGAGFNSNKEKIVCYPSVWFGPTIGHNTSDLCPSVWNKIEA